MSVIDQATELERNKNVILRFCREYQSTADHDPAVLEELIHPNAADHSERPDFPHGPSAVHQAHQELFDAFSGFHVEVRDQLAEGDKVVTYKRFHGRHTGPWMGVAATGRIVAFENIDIVRIVDGKIYEHWNVVDRHGLLRQLRGD
ncbi:ester cyclase [Flexivirga meconopsidis]|uniref:ester cyclase n=1 Tax=Flexivirga meconopsidis TaxID=2977121 RepID=UPI0022405615|nr:ester cyclase [Flexivirga meconopsidis]